MAISVVLAGLLAVGALYGFCYLVSLLFQPSKPKTRISLQYFISNSHKLNKSDIKFHACTNFRICAVTNNVIVMNSTNHHIHLGHLLKIFNSQYIPPNAYLYDLPANITDKLALRNSA